MKKNKKARKAREREKNGRHKWFLLLFPPPLFFVHPIPHHVIIKEIKCEGNRNLWQTVLCGVYALVEKAYICFSENCIFPPQTFVSFQKVPMVQNALEKEELWLGEKNITLCFG